MVTLKELTEEARKVDCYLATRKFEDNYKKCHAAVIKQIRLVK